VARGAAAGTAAAVAVAGAASAAAAAVTPAASGSWRIVKQIHSGELGDVTAVTAVGRTGGWAFNGESGPTAWERSGSTWKKVSFPGKANESVMAAASSSPTNVWAFTSNFGSPSRALRWNGHRWSAVRSFSGQITGAAVLRANDVWVFNGSVFPGSDHGSWHYNGRTWSYAASGHGLQGGSGLSASNVWAYGGSSVAHWNGHTWSHTSVQSLLPAKNPEGLNDPAVTAIYAQSSDSVWAIGNGNDEDDGGPMVVLHYNGHKWTKVATGSGGGMSFQGQVAPDGSGGLWIPLAAAEGGTFRLLHYSGGHLTAVKLPVSASAIVIDTIAAIPGTKQVLAGGLTHAAGKPGTDNIAVILQYGS
jgi:hypothetical protein